MLRRILYASSGFMLACVVWYGCYWLQLFPPQLFPSPHTVLADIVLQLITLSFWTDLTVSIYRVLIGFLLAGLLAVPFGIYMSLYGRFDAAYTPFNNFVRYLPVAALVPLVMLWFGTGNLQKAIVIFIGTFFQLTLMTRDNFSQVPKGLIETGEVLGARSQWRLIRTIVIPSRLPYVFDDLKVALGWAWSYLLVAEVIAAQRGIGFKIMQANRFLQTPRIMALIVVVGIVGIIMDWIFERINRTLFRWRHLEPISR